MGNSSSIFHKHFICNVIQKAYKQLVHQVVREVPREANKQEFCDVIRILIEDYPNIHIKQLNIDNAIVVLNNIEFSVTINENGNYSISKL